AEERVSRARELPEVPEAPGGAAVVARAAGARVRAKRFGREDLLREPQVLLDLRQRLAVGLRGRMDPIPGKRLGEVARTAQRRHAQEEDGVEYVVEALVERPRPLPGLAAPERRRLEHVRGAAPSHRAHVQLAGPLRAELARVLVEPDGVSVGDGQAGVAVEL